MTIGIENFNRHGVFHFGRTDCAGKCLHNYFLIVNALANCFFKLPNKLVFLFLRMAMSIRALVMANFSSLTVKLLVFIWLLILIARII